MMTIGNFFSQGGEKRRVGENLNEYQKMRIHLND